MKCIIWHSCNCFCKLLENILILSDLVETFFGLCLSAWNIDLVRLNSDGFVVLGKLWRHSFEWFDKQLVEIVYLYIFIVHVLTMYICIPGIYFMYFYVMSTLYLFKCSLVYWVHFQCACVYCVYVENVLSIQNLSCRIRFEIYTGTQKGNRILTGWLIYIFFCATNWIFLNAEICFQRRNGLQYGC